MPVDLQDVYLTSVLEDEIENFVMKPGVNNPVVYINRSFVTQPQNPQQPQARDYFDLLSNQLDSKAKSKVDSLASKLDSRCTEKLQMSLSWCDETGFSPRSNPEHVKYLDSLCEQYYGKMKVLLESSMKQVLVQAENFRQKGVSSNLHEELVNLFKHIFIKNSFKFFGGREAILKKIESYIASGHTGQSDTAVRPLLLTGSHGSGASGICILTNGIVHTVPGWEGSVCVLRILKLSTRARTVETMLHCILEQVCLAYDLPMSYATRSLKEQQKLFYNILEKVTAKNPLIIIMDGLQDLIPTPGGQVEWIPAELPPNVRIIVTATEDGLQKMKLPSSTHSLSIPPFTKEEGEFLLNRILELHSRTLTPSQRGEVISAIERCPSPIYAVTLSAMASHWHSYTSDMQNRIKGSTEEQFGLLLDEMDEKYGVDCVKQILGYFSCAKTGLTDNELIDLVLCDKVIMNKLDGDAFAARSVWNRLCIDIEYLLMYRMVYGLITFQWKHSVFADCVMKRYFPKAEDIQAVHRLLMQYYEGNLKLNVSLGSTIPQPIKFGNTFNLRKLTELPYQMVKSGCVEKVKTQCLLNLEFLMAKMESVGVDGVIEDVAMAVQINPNDQELQQLYQLLQMSAFALSLDPSRLWMQFTSRVGKASLCPPIQQLCDESKSVIHDEGWFETKSPVSHVLDQMPSDEKVGQALVTGIFKLKTDPAHVVTVSTSQKKVQVWNLTSGKAVRTLMNIPQPRNVRMVDDYRAVVLCNRELKVFDLNQGTLLSELKGVLNVERPYFEIMDENHAVTLSRNRMYVNIMELETGSQESTFKVGEDRFLDSLFVSADGQMCVCGDEVQKPFPLLVWDLPNKKLIHDMRIPNHEFLTSMAAISHDGQYVVSVCKEVDDPAPNFLTIYDLQSGQMYKKWTPEVSTCAVAISSAGHCVVNCLETGTLMVWDLVAGGLRHELSGHRQGVDRILISDSGTRCVSYSTNNIDQTVKLWDLTKGACLASFTSDVPLTSCELSMDGNAVILGLEGREDIVVLQLCLKEGGLQMITDGSYGDDSLKDKEFDPMAK
ncbi:NACHT domain- and WD repeat-containing protein 1 isoform X1 [Lingula anatina]|uniref:NACHT domain- and WD repeat-containing protein 1 isoform X1 n=1 Tax=Lingula anatina TaxID=7574 RepID=A0A1S3HX86_LINAN|nr:NACHT domain- and WD repeat-containing protein 1 isoform X1 [Lingula anatina]|eukprot:XP_013389679.1 NACHT domain- and WD repeat-containing protein 1 isoform X1 [Lingula anatina]